MGGQSNAFGAVPVTRGEQRFFFPPRDFFFPLHQYVFEGVFRGA